MRAWTFAAALSAVVLCGCRPAVAPKPYSEVLDSWVGGDANELVRRLGAPTRTMTMPNGNRLLIYREDDSYFTPAVPLLGVPSQPVSVSCQTEFEIDHSARILRWRAQGQICPH